MNEHHACKRGTDQEEGGDRQEEQAVGRDQSFALALARRTRQKCWWKRTRRWAEWRACRWQQLGREAQRGEGSTQIH